MQGNHTQEAKFFGGRPDAVDMNRMIKDKEDKEALAHAGPSDPRDSGADMSLYQSPEYYDQQMKLLPPEIRPFHLAVAEKALAEAGCLRPMSINLDLCCGTGWASLSLAASYPGVFFVGVDDSEAMLQVARERATNSGLRNVFFICGDAEMLRFNDLRIPIEITKGRQHFDGVISAFGLSVVPNWHAALCASWRLVRPGGVYAILDLHFTKEEGDELDKEESLAKKALPSQDHSRRLWDALETMPMLDECRVNSHPDKKSYYCAIGIKERIGNVDLETVSKNGNDEAVPAIQKWDEDSKDFKAVTGPDDFGGEVEEEEEPEPEIPFDMSGIEPKRSAETIAEYCSRLETARADQAAAFRNNASGHGAECD